MQNYIATFHTHLSAMLSARALERSGAAERVAMSPVPRRLSSSCGTCVRYSANEPNLSLMDCDMESVYEDMGGDEYRLIHIAQEQ